MARMIANWEATEGTEATIHVANRRAVAVNDACGNALRIC